jgi:hypothetical protein
LIKRALVDDLAIVQASPVWANGVTAADVGDMAMLHTVHGRQRNGIPFPPFGCDKFIDIDGMNKLRARSIATTVARRFLASDYTGQEDVSYHG